LDFGLARALDQAAPSSSSSNTGLVGTFAYIAPEQLEGKPFSTASDVYSFGMVWFEMLTGELPFNPTSSPALPAHERLTRPVPAPSSLNPRVPKELDAVVLACLCRSSTARLQTAGDVLARLDALSTQKPRPPRGRALAPWTILAVLAAGALYFVLGMHDRPKASADEPRSTAAKAPPAPPGTVESPVTERSPNPTETAPPALPPSK
jgi:serine/threonine protein kinase